MAAPSATVARYRAQLARRTQSYPPHHPRVVEARRGLAIEQLAEHARRVVEGWPKPTSEQLQRVAAILLTAPGGVSVDAA